jgi:uncharacterized protein
VTLDRGIGLRRGITLTSLLHDAMASICLQLPWRRCGSRRHMRSGCRDNAGLTRSEMRMTQRACCYGSILALALALPVPALAQGPAFDCSKAQGEVEKLICSDASLAELDRKLAAVYKAAGAKAQGKLATRLREEQRGWVKGRNECWKANGQQTWITATWTVNTVKGCIDAQYRLRTSELQSVWRLVPPRTASYACQNNPANEVVANFFDTDPATIRLERGDRSKTLWRVGAGTSATFEGQNVSVVQQGNELRVNWLDTDTGKTEDLQCRTR